MEIQDTRVMFGRRLRQLRAEVAMTQTELAKRLGVTRACIANWESATREPDTIYLNKLSVIFDVSIDYMLGRTDIRNYLQRLNRMSSSSNCEYILDISSLNPKNKRALTSYYTFLKKKQFLEK